MRVWLDPMRMAAHGLTPADVEIALRRENAQIPGGRVEGSGREFSVQTRGDLTTPEEFGNIIVSEQTATGYDSTTSRRWRWARRMTARSRATTANPPWGWALSSSPRLRTVDVANAVRKALPELKAALPAGMRLDVAYDSSAFINDSIRQVGETLLIAMCLVVLVVVVFMKNLRATLIPTLAIPVSIIGTFAVIYFLGFTINILTLLALVLAIGLVVDDAIVVLENIFRHMEMGKTRMQAAFDGSKEIGFAVLATTIALVAVFVPVAFLTGDVGRLFREFGYSVAIAVAISGFVALTLTPMFSSRILQTDPRNRHELGGADV